MDAEVVRELLGVRSPEFPQDLAVGDDAPRVADEDPEQAVLLDGQVHLRAAAANATVGEVDLDISETYDGGFAWCEAAAEEDADAGEEFAW